MNQQQNNQINDIVEDFYEFTQDFDRELLTKKAVGNSPDELLQLIAKASVFDSEVKFRNILKKSKFNPDDIISALFDVTSEVEKLINTIQNKASKISNDDEISDTKTISKIATKKSLIPDKTTKISDEKNLKDKKKLTEKEIESILLTKKPSYLSKLNLSNLDFEGIDFTQFKKNKKLQYLNFLWSANFSNSNLKNANLSNQVLTNANFTNANLQNTNFSGASLVGANFSNASIENTNFNKAKLNLANFRNAKIKNANVKAEDEKSLFGKYAWSDKDWQSNYISELPPKETSTAIEQELYKLLIKHFSDNIPLGDKAYILIDLINKNQYSNVLKRYTGTFYRGMKNVDVNTIAKFANISTKELLNMLNKQKQVIIKKNLTYKPKNITSSWTEDIDKAKEFSYTSKFLAQRDNPNSQYGIILKANSSKNKNLIKCDGALYKIVLFSEYEDELEVISVGDIVIDELIIQK